MKVKVLNEAGYKEALLGLSLSYKQPTIDRMPEVALHLCDKDGGHNKFLESIVVWLDITAPRYWWQQFDTYRVGITKQSESTMHTILNRPFRQEDFAYPIASPTLARLNCLVRAGLFTVLKNELPEGFLQRRIACLNYKVLRHIIVQRYSHRLIEWREFISQLFDQLEHSEFLSDLRKDKSC